MRSVVPSHPVSGAASPSSSITVVVPTYRRPDDLARCLSGIELQTRPAAQVVVVHREDDVDTRAILDGFAQRLPLVPTIVSGNGAVRAYNRGLATATGDIVAITDDDAVPHADWLARLTDHFERDAALGAVGGRDVVHQNGQSIAPSRSIVGVIQTSGRMIGNHHLGLGGPRPVHVLKGVNMSFRAAAIQGCGFDARLRGEGAQVHLEIGLCTAVLKAGWGIVYDPLVLVDHFPSIRHDSDQRTGFSLADHVNAVHNETLALLDYLPWPRRGLFITWAMAVGTRQSPGLLHAARGAVLGGGRGAWERFVSTVQGRIEGGRTWLRNGS